MTHESPQRIGLMADAHGNLHFARKAIKDLAALGITEIHALGDFGFVWDGSQRDALKLKPLELDLKKAGAVLYVTGGNHENYTRLLAIEPDANGLRWIRKHIALLPRGWRSATAGGVTIASLGGANSIDRYERKPAINGRPGSWWPEEQITDADLDALGTEPVDVLLGHDSPLSQRLAHKLIRNQHMWNPRGLAYAQLGQAMFHRGFLQVRPKLTLSGHYHLFVDATEEFEAEGEPFTSRVVVMNAEWQYPSVAVLDTEDLGLTFLEPLAG